MSSGMSGAAFLRTISWLPVLGVAPEIRGDVLSNEAHELANREAAQANLVRVAETAAGRARQEAEAAAAAKQRAEAQAAETAAE